MIIVFICWLIKDADKYNCTKGVTADEELVLVADRKVFKMSGISTGATCPNNNAAKGTKCK